MKPLIGIELKVRDNYEQVKVIFEGTLKLMLQYQHEGKFKDWGLCSKLKETTYQLFPGSKLFDSVIVPWFTPDRFNIEYLYFYFYYPELSIIPSLTLITRNDFEKAWYQVKLDKVPEPYIKSGFWFQVERVYEQNRIDRDIKVCIKPIRNTKSVKGIKEKPRFLVLGFFVCFHGTP